MLVNLPANAKHFYLIPTFDFRQKISFKSIRLRCIQGGFTFTKFGVLWVSNHIPLDRILPIFPVDADEFPSYSLPVIILWSPFVGTCSGSCSRQGHILALSR